MTYRTLLGIVVAVLALAGGLALSVVLRQGEEERPQAAGPMQPVVTIERPVIKHSEEDRLAWQLRLKRIEVTQGAGELSAEGLQEALIYSTSGEPLVRVTAQRVSGTTGGPNFEVSGQVTVVSYQGVVINTDTVQWRQGQGHLHCPGLVNARSREAQFSTRGITYDVNQSLVTAPGQVNLQSGPNKIVGRNMRFHVDSGNFTVEQVQMVFTVEEARRRLQGATR